MEMAITNNHKFENIGSLSPVHNKQTKNNRILRIDSIFNSLYIVTYKNVTKGISSIFGFNLGDDVYNISFGNLCTVNAHIRIVL